MFYNFLIMYSFLRTRLLQKLIFLCLIVLLYFNYFFKYDLKKPFVRPPLHTQLSYVSKNIVSKIPKQQKNDYKSQELVMSTTCVPLNNISIKHSHSNKPWSKNNKFLVEYNNKQMNMKTGNQSIVNEYAYYIISLQMDSHEIVLETTLVANNQHALGVLSPWMPEIKSGWDISHKCLDICGHRSSKIAIIDYLVGYIDRPANCHIIDDLPFAIDNDSGSITQKIQHNNIKHQYNKLEKSIQETPLKACRCIKPHLKLFFLRLPKKPHCFSIQQWTFFKSIFKYANYRLKHLVDFSFSTFCIQNKTQH